MSGEEIIASFKRYIVKFLGGMIRTVAKGGNESGESLNEGKKLMAYNLYNKLYEILFSGGGEKYLFAHVFLVLKWKLLARSNKCLSINNNHVQWSDGCLLLYFGKL